MSHLVRLGISLDSDLLEAFEARNQRKGYTNRSEAIRDLIRNVLVQEDWEEAKGSMAAVLSIVYDHHQLDLPKRLTQAQHDHHDLIVTTVHVHLDHHHCLECLILRGEAKEIRTFADRMISMRGVQNGHLAVMGRTHH